MRLQVDDLAVVFTGNIEQAADHVLIKTWVKNHPIARDFVYRQATIAKMETLVGEQEMGALQSVGGLAVSINDIAKNIIVYMNLLTKQAHWQAELVLTGSDDKQGIQDGLESLNELGDFVNNIAPIVDQMPDLVARERETVLETMRRERIEVLANIDQQRVDTLRYLTTVQLAIRDDIISERKAVMDILQSEREVILQSIDEERNATLIEIESTGNRIVSETLKQSVQLIDHFFIRAIQLFAVIMFCGIVVTAIFFI